MTTCWGTNQLFWYLAWWRSWNYFLHQLIRSWKKRFEKIYIVNIEFITRNSESYERSQYITFIFSHYALCISYLTDNQELLKLVSFPLFSSPQHLIQVWYWVRRNLTLFTPEVEVSLITSVIPRGKTPSPEVMCLI